MTDYRSNVIKDLRTTIYNIELQIIRADSEIYLAKEQIEFYKGTTKKSELTILVNARIRRDNFRVFRNRLIQEKNRAYEKITSISQKYNGIYSEIFMLYFFEDKTEEEIAQITHRSVLQIKRVIFRLKNDIKEYKKREQ